MIGVTPLMIDLWLRMERMAEKSSGGLEPPSRHELARTYDADGLIRTQRTREFFEGILLSKDMDEVCDAHISHFEAQIDTFHRNFDVFKSILGPKLKNFPRKMKGFNIMVSRADFESRDPFQVTSSLVREASLSIVPEACFVTSDELSRNDGSYFRLSLATEPSLFRAACRRFAEWAPS